MSIYKIKFVEEIPKYQQVASYFKDLIDKGNINDGEKLPTIRYLSEDLKVNNITIVNAYKKLVNDGYAFQKIGSGTYAKKRDIISKFNREYSRIFKLLKEDNISTIIDFSGETNFEVFFPMKEFKKVINDVLDRDGADALIVKEPLGYQRLREAINSFFWKSKVNLDDLLIVSGAQQGIDIASKALLNINENVIVEKPTYAGALSVFKWKRANIFEVNLDEDGINIEEFEEILKKNKIKCFYTISFLHNPSGISYSTEKKIKILELANKYDFYIIEDDYLSELIYSNKLNHMPFKKLDTNDRVIYIKSFSKVFLPGIRLGYIISPKRFSEVLQASKINTDIATSSLMQRALDLYIREGYFIHHIKEVEEIYQKRYKYMRELLKEKLSDFVDFYDPKGGLSFYLNIKDNLINSIDLFYKLKNRGVYITPGVLFYRYSKDGEYKFKISFTQVNEIKIAEGIQIIREEFIKCLI